MKEHIPTSLAVGSSLLAQTIQDKNGTPWWAPLAMQIVALCILYVQGRRKGPKP